ncbi:MAG: PHP domain-containing protein [Phycisphaerales bacterium]|nr:PHP domain-containing protein [Phycisphaerales bacterium]
MDRLKTVIHVHTTWSHDSNARPADVVELALARGVQVVAITDHDEIGGAIEAQARRRAGVQVIVGEEISTTDGHIIGLFLTDRIPPGLSGEETCRRIRAQGGLVLAPHPYTILCSGSLGGAALRKLLPWLDAVEVCNAQDPLAWENRWAQHFRAEHGLAGYVGADAHIRGHLDACYQLVTPFAGPAEFREALRAAQLVPGRFGPAYFARMAGRHVYEAIARRPWPGFGVHVPARRPAAEPDAADDASLQVD